MVKIYNIDEKYLFEIIEDYKETDSENDKYEIFNAFCSSIWGSSNKRSVHKKSIRYNVTGDLINTEIGKVFCAWSSVEYTGYRSMSKTKDYCSLIRQKINNIYTTLFDKDVILNKEYMDLIGTPKKLYYSYRNGNLNVDAKELTTMIDFAIDDSILVREKYQKQKMDLSWNKYKKLTEEYLKKIFDNCVDIDSYIPSDKLNITVSFWNEDNFYIKYFCKSLSGYFKNYQKEYFGVRQHKKYGYCEKCGRMFEKKHKLQRLCEKCSTYKKIGTKIIKCIDCGDEFEVDGNVNRRKRCLICQRKKQLEYQKASMKKIRSNVK